MALNWDADDVFGSPPEGPFDRDFLLPHENDTMEFSRIWGHDSHGLDNEVPEDEVHPVSEGPTSADIDRYRVHSALQFELRTEHDGDSPGLCTFLIDSNRGLIKRMTKNGYPSEESFKRPWGFLISKEERTEHGGRRRIWWTIKVVLDRRADDHYSKYTKVLWSAPTMALSNEKMQAFAMWARSHFFETVCDFSEWQW